MFKYKLMDAFAAVPLRCLSLSLSLPVHNTHTEIPHGMNSGKEDSALTVHCRWQHRVSENQLHLILMRSPLLQDF